MSKKEMVREFFCETTSNGKILWKLFSKIVIWTNDVDYVIKEGDALSVSYVNEYLQLIHITENLREVVYIPFDGIDSIEIHKVM